MYQFPDKGDYDCLKMRADIFELEWEQNNLSTSISLCEESLAAKRDVEAAVVSLTGSYVA